MFWRPVMAGAMATLAILYAIADSFLHHQRDVQTCGMSYSRPSFYEIPLATASHPKYKLYLFRQGLVDSTERLLGVPGLFVPGHAGSYKQVRSIAAETAEQYGSAAIDYFTVDLNEEFSGLSGQQLLDQAEFLNDAVRHILGDLYQDRYSAVVVVGHSMGGIVARLMPWMTNYRPSSLHHILTLATPHAQPPIVLDPVMTEVYATIHRHHRKQDEMSLVSIAGGTADTIVNSDMAHQGADVTVFSTGVPGVWTSCDHMAILWCNQLVRVVATVLAESIDLGHVTGLKARDDRVRIARKYLLAPHPRLQSSSQTSVVSYHTSRQSVLPAKHVFSAVDDTVLIGTDGEKVGIVTDAKDVVFTGCAQSADGPCHLLASGEPLELPRPQAGSAVYYYRSVGEAYIGVRSRSPGFVLADIESGSAKQVNATVWDLLWWGVDLPVSPTGIYSHFKIPTLRHPFFAYQLIISYTTPECPNDRGPAFTPVVRQSYDHEQKYPHVQLGVAIPIHFYGQSGRSAAIEIWKSYPIRAHLRLDWYGSIGKAIIRVAPSLPVYLFIIALMTLQEVASQGRDFDEGLIHCLRSRVPKWASIIFVLGWIGSTNGMPWWLQSFMFCLAAGHICLLWVVLHVLLVGCRKIIRRSCAQPVCSATLPIALLVCCSSVMPVSAIVIFVYLYWFGCTALCSQKGDVYQAVLMVLTSLLPYNVPGVIVYIKDVMVLGWPVAVSWKHTLPHLPMLAMVLFLVMSATWYPGVMKSRAFVVISQYLIVLGIYSGVRYHQAPFHDLSLSSLFGYLLN